MGADEIDFEKIPDGTFVIYQGHHGDKAVSRADLIIPTPCFTEKEGIYVNMEGRVQISRQVNFQFLTLNIVIYFLTSYQTLLE